MHTEKATEDNLADALRVSRTLEYPHDPGEVERFLLGDDGIVLIENTDVVGWIGLVVGDMRSFKLSLLPEYRTQETIERLINEVDGNKIDLPKEDVWLLIALQRGNFKVVDTFWQPNSDGGYTLHKL